ncbi:carbohydrate kinase family protein [Candidatus Similichlamydia epinepheli]|uniref:carbohydrate kinase family protein n=1 Tax=Candidatus Similichlamydia epinepheli TaxID=1903953 RepID=UPI00130078E7|nr:carbohydrate kinase family protein [Candidatus Similichlamydia epinepheli]
MIESYIPLLSAIGFFLPVYDCFVPMDQRDRTSFLRDYFEDIQTPFHERSLYKLSCNHFDKLICKLEKSGVSAKFSPGSILLNSLQHLGRAGVLVDIATSHGTGSSYAVLDKLYNDLFNKKFFCSTSYTPPRLIYLHTAQEVDPVVLLTTPYKEGLPKDIIINLPSLHDYHAVLMDGHIFPFSVSLQIVRKAFEEGVLVALSCGKSAFLKKHRREYLDNLHMISMFSCNLEEAQMLTDKVNIGDCATAIQQSLKTGGKVLITNAENDFCIASPNHKAMYSTIPFPKDQIVNTIGCGDAAAAAFFLGCMLNLPDDIQASLVSHMGRAALASPDTSVPKEKIVEIILDHNLVPKT